MKLLEYVYAHATEGDVTSVINTIDQYCHDGHVSRRRSDMASRRTKGERECVGEEMAATQQADLVPFSCLA